MGDEIGQSSSDGGSAKFGVIEALMVGAVFYFILNYVDPALRLGFGLLALTALGAYLAIAFGLDKLHNRLPDGNSPDAVAIKFAAVVAIVLGAAFLCFVIQGDLAQRQGMKLLMLAVAASDLVLAFALIMLNAQTAIASLIVNVFIMISFSMIPIDKFCLQMSRTDYLFSAAVIAAIAFVLGRGVVGVLAVRSLVAAGRS